MDKRSAVSDQQKINNQAKALDDYHQRILNLQAMVNSRDAQLAAAAQRERELREALEPFAQPELYRQLGGNIEGDDSIIFVRDDAELRLGDFRRAARLLASADGMQGEGGGEG